MARRPPPPLLLTLALLFWGWFSGLWWVALPLVLLAELPRLTPWRFALGPRERQRVADLCTLLITLVGVWLALREPRLGTALIELIRWLPLLLFPLLAVQLFDGRDETELSVLFLSLRGPGKPAGAETLDLRWAFLVLCVIAAAMTRPEATGFLPALALLTGYALWPVGVTGARAALPRLLALGAGFTLALALAAGLRLGHDQAELLALRWLEQWMGTAEDPYRATTAIGEVGRVKDSDRIRLRLYPPADGGAVVPRLLLTATYDRYIDDTWFTSGMAFAPLSRRDGAWALVDEPGDGRRYRALMTLNRPEGLLPLARDAARLWAPSLETLARSSFGAVRFRHRGAPYLAYEWNGGARPVALPPDPAELRVPRQAAPAVAAFIDQHGLRELPPAAAMARLEALFASDFRYTLDLPAVPAERSPIGHFLLDARAGHCEYFASAAALVLRALGLPARYARGFAVQEYSPLEGAWIARDRHAHAWVEVWHGGAWHTFDPTPPDWTTLEASGRPWTLWLTDRIARLRFLLAGGASATPADRTWLLWPLAGLIALLGWRIARRGRRRGGTSRPDRGPAGAPGHPFVALERRLARRGLGRRPGETLLEWAARLEAQDAPTGAALAGAVTLYYRQRFDPRGLSAEGRANLARAVAQGF